MAIAVLNIIQLQRAIAVCAAIENALDKDQKTGSVMRKPGE